MVRSVEGRLPKYAKEGKKFSLLIDRTGGGNTTLVSRMILVPFLQGKDGPNYLKPTDHPPTAPIPSSGVFDWHVEYSV